MFAHRGVYAHAREENTLPAFEKALRSMDGFECDVRLSSDGVPVVVHDATLQRTHGVPTRVDALSAAELRALGVPTAREVLELRRLKKGKCVVLDLKEHERLLCRLLSAYIDACEGQVVLLSWSDRRPTPRHTVYRATDYRFSPWPTFDGVACKFSGSAVNVGCINRALAQGTAVNLFAPRNEDQEHMVRMYGARCSYTVARGHASGAPEGRWDGFV